MNVSKGFILAVFLSVIVGCAGNGRLRHVDSLRQNSNWPTIRAAAELEVARKQGNARWSHSAYYAPEEHTNGIWHVVASGPYPLNRLGDSIDLLIKDGGEVVGYSPRMRDYKR